MPYAIEIAPSAQRDMRALDRKILRRIDRKILALAEDPRPHGVKKLEEGAYRVRVGDWRILYLIEDTRLLVLVVRVRHRSEVYERR